MYLGKVKYHLKSIYKVTELIQILEHYLCHILLNYSQNNPDIEEKAA